jgi:hypothetical protein
MSSDISRAIWTNRLNRIMKLDAVLEETSCATGRDEPDIGTINDYNTKQSGSGDAPLDSLTIASMPLHRH